MTRDYSKFVLPGSTPTPTPAKTSRLQHYGWQPFFSQQLSADDLTQTPPARVVEVHRNALHVIGDDLDEIIPPIDGVTVGDWVLLNRDQPAHSVMLERKSLIKRRAPGLERVAQLIAANICLLYTSPSPRDS